jgi:hypothetical protein
LADQVVAGRAGQDVVARGGDGAALHAGQGVRPYVGFLNFSKCVVRFALLDDFGRFETNGD